MMQPYQLIKDHRTKVERGDVQKVLDGDLDPFIRAYLLARKPRASSKSSQTMTQTPLKCRPDSSCVSTGKRAPKSRA